MEEQAMITLTEAADELGVGMTSLYRYIKKYDLKTFRKLGDKRGYLRLADIERLKGFTPKDERKAS